MKLAASLEFQKKILQLSGIGDETYILKAIMSQQNISTMKGREGRRVDGDTWSAEKGIARDEGGMMVYRWGRCEGKSVA